MKKLFFQLFGPLCLALVFTVNAQAQPADPHGSASSIPAYYDHVLLKIQFVEFSPQAEKALLAHNPSLNFIFQSDPGLPGGQPFISVIDAVPGDGFNPIWEEIQITFTPGHTPRQLFSDDEIIDALNSGEITLTATGEVYWCPVVGPKK
ncbi:MAG TPA: hypothetical protein VFF11_02220 [Candidatus Binatia bacterium]|nr:hypothetical protein [Candidatus Binatia bacterium]